VILKVLTAVFAGLTVLFAVSGFARRAHRAAHYVAAACAAFAAVAAHYDGFWPMVCFGLLALWAGLAGLDWVDFGWRVRAGLTLSLTLLGFVTLWPSIDAMSGGKVPCPAWVKERQTYRLVAGLDLRGGLRLVYTVDVDEAIKDKRDRYYEFMQASLAKAYGFHDGDKPPTEEALRKLRERVSMEAPRRPANQIFITFKVAADVDGKLDARFRDQFRGELGDPKIEGPRATYQIREMVETSIREQAVTQAKEIILRRVDELGLREAAVSTRGEDIIIEVPGQDEKTFNEIRDIVSQTARLEFKMVDDDSDFFEKLKEKTATDEALKKALPEGLEFMPEVVPVGLNEQGERVTRQNTYAVLTKKPDETSQAALGRLKKWVETLQVPADREVGYELEYRTTDEATLAQEESAWRTYMLKQRADITGDMIRDAAAVPDQSDKALGGWHVQLNFTDQGGRIFDEVTAANVKRRFAIILDGRTSSAPEILTRISGGVASITLGTRDPDAQLRDAKKLELVLKSGALPAPISPSNEQRIGPSLGKDSIKLGVQGAIGSSLLVLLFMWFYYRKAGLVADVAVVLNVFLQLAVLASFGASMTLPGIAGLALTVGMGVDANVLINERIRDEQRIGKGGRTAVALGFDRALSAILDGNLTTVIAGVILAQYGTGPIKGFAVTLTVGVLVNIFCAVFVARVLFDWWVNGLGRSAQLDVG
jgi:preprotein translocase subunit SecD